MKPKQLQRLRAAAGLAALALASCSGSGTSPDKATQQNIAANVLTFSVGTANIYGSATGLNVYASYRQANGLSGALDTEPTLSGPLAGHLPSAGSASNLDATSTAPSGPAPTDTASLTFTAPGGSALTTFGTSGGVFGVGIEPFNYNNQGGTPATYTPYAVPLFDFTSDTNSFIPWGGPPAFDETGVGRGVFNGAPVPPGVLGVSEGLDVFYGVTPVAGSPYSLSVTVPATSQAPVTATATATITTVHYLPAITAPAPGFQTPSTGSTEFSVSLPTGVTEEYVQVEDIGPAGGSGEGCNGAGAPGSGGTPIYYTLKFTSSGTLFILDKNAPLYTTTKLAPPAICTASQNAAAGGPSVGDSLIIQAIGFDYDAYSLSYPGSNGVQNPAPPSQVDITISPQITAVSS